MLRYDVLQWLGVVCWYGNTEPTPTHVHVLYNYDYVINFRVSLISRMEVIVVCLCANLQSGSVPGKDQGPIPIFHSSSGTCPN